MKELRIINVDKDNGQEIEPEIKFSNVKLKEGLKIEVFTDECGEDAQVLKLEIFDGENFSKELEFEDTINSELFIDNYAFIAADLVDPQVLAQGKTVTQIVYDSILVHAGNTYIEFNAHWDPVFEIVEEIEIYINVNRYKTKMEISWEEAKDFLIFTE